MMRYVIVRDFFSKKPDVLHEIDVRAPVPVGELVPRATDLVAQLREPLGWREPVARRRVELHAGRQSIAFGRNDPGSLALGEDRLRAREGHQADVSPGDSAMLERELDGAARKTEMVLDPGYALFLQREQDPLRRAHARRGVVTEMNSKREWIVHEARSV